MPEVWPGPCDARVEHATRWLFFFGVACCSQDRLVQVGMRRDVFHLVLIRALVQIDFENPSG